jgi:hypothetical protein
VASLRPKRVNPLVRFEGLPAEFSQHDFGQVEVEFCNGASQWIHFFASRLKDLAAAISDRILECGRFIHSMGRHGAPVT